MYVKLRRMQVEYNVPSHHTKLPTLPISEQPKRRSSTSRSPESGLRTKQAGVVVNKGTSHLRTRRSLNQNTESIHLGSWKTTCCLARQLQRG
jgi:hypothetical protein